MAGGGVVARVARHGRAVAAGARLRQLRLPLVEEPAVRQRLVSRWRTGLFYVMFLSLSCCVLFFYFILDATFSQPFQVGMILLHTGSTQVNNNC